MGTRADFYVGTGKSAEWLGSVPWDGYQWAEEEVAEDDESGILYVATEKKWRSIVWNILSNEEGSTRPEDGWPWPWDDSSTTDYVYFWHNGVVRYETFSDNEWPDMRQRKNVTFGPRSGLLFIKG